MKTIYIDSDFKCHLTDDGTMTRVETNFFDAKCPEFIEGYRFIPAGETWTLEDGTIFQGEMISPWKPWQELDDAQREYERELIREYEKSMTGVQAEADTLRQQLAELDTAYAEGVQSV